MRIIIFASILVLCLPNDFSAQTRRAAREPSLPILGLEAEQPDTVASKAVSDYEDLTKRVDSLQSIMNYNAGLLKENLDRRLVWVYAMLGIIIIACMIIYGTLSSAQRQGKQMEERINRQVATVVSQLESQIRNVEAGLKSRRSPPKPTARRTKKSR